MAIVDGKLVEVDKDYHRHCGRYNPVTGRCRDYNKKRLRLCLHWKCTALNWLSRLLGEPMWNGTMEGDPLDLI